MPRLTKRLIDNTPCPEQGQTFLRDTSLPGFALRLTPGSKSFILERRIQGRVRRMTLGPYGALTLDEARSKARIWIGGIVDGRDPDQERNDRKHEPTFKDLKDIYLERHVSRKKSAHDLKAMIRNHLAGWDNHRLSTITRNQVAVLHGRIGRNAPYVANRLVALLRNMFNQAVKWGIYSGENPATGIELFKEEKRDRFIQKDELPKIMESILQEKNIFIQGAFLMSLLTGARIGEVRTMQWKDVNLSSGVWRIPETKAGRSHMIPLPRHALAILKSLPKINKNPYIFPGVRKSAHLTDVSKAWQRIRTRAGLPDVRIHDLRRTLGSWLAGSGASLPLIGKVLNHSQAATTMIYARMDLASVRAALDANADRMNTVSGGFLMLKGRNDDAEESSQEEAEQER